MDAQTKKELVVSLHLEGMVILSKVNQVLQVHQVMQDSREYQDQRDHKVPLGTKDHRDYRVQMDLRDHLALQDLQGYQVNPQLHLCQSCNSEWT